MPANPFDESLVQGVYDTPAEVDPQWIPTPPDPLAGPGNPQSPRRLHDPLMGGPAVPHLEGEDGVGMMAADEQEDPDVHQAQDVRLVPEENGVPPTVLQARMPEPTAATLAPLLQRMPVLVDLSHLPLNDLERIVDYVSDLGHDANLPVGEIERATFGLLMIGNQNRWDVSEIERVARQVVNNAYIEYMLDYDADDEEEDVRLFVLERVEEPPQDRRLILERRNALIPPAEPEQVDDPPPQYRLEEAAPRHGNEVPELDMPETLYSITLEFRNETHLHFEVVISFTVFLSIACGVPIGVGMFVFSGLIRAVSSWPPGGPIYPIVNNTLLPLLNQVMSSWATFLVMMSDLRTFHTLVSINVLGVVVNALALASLFYLIARVTRMAVRGAAGMVVEQA